MRGSTFFLRALFVCVLTLAGGLGCRFADTPDRLSATGPELPGQPRGVFTTAHSSIGEAVSHFFLIPPDPEQPIEFPHNIHVAQGIGCTDYCHATVTTGPRAGIPGVNTCMICHIAIATDRPRIQQITSMQAEGIDLAWERVFGYPEESHVRFNHAPHIRAEVECATCHGNIAEQTVAERNVDMTMGFCLDCHNERQVSTDCLTCHF